MSASTKFYPLTVREIRRETADTVSIAFNVPPEQADLYRFTQGQYLTLRTRIGEQDVRRSYSICSGVDEGELRVAVKKVPQGVFSTFANEVLKTGDQLLVMPPQGRFFTELHPSNHNQYVAFAAGSGITPILSILKTTLQREPGSSFLLFYGNRSFDHIIFQEELQHLKNLYPERLSVHHVLTREMLGSPLFYGRLDADKCRQYAGRLFQPAEVAAFFLCGPEEMTLGIREALETLGADPKNIHAELFAAPGALRKPETPASSTEAAFDAQVTVLQDGMQFEFKLMSDGSTLLDAAMRAGADLPFSCKGGVCSTCKAKVLEGAVRMDINYALEADELEAGYVLTCQSHPKSARLVVSFDA